MRFEPNIIAQYREKRENRELVGRLIRKINSDNRELLDAFRKHQEIDRAIIRALYSPQVFQDRIA